MDLHGFVQHIIATVERLIKDLDLTGLPYLQNYTSVEQIHFQLQ